MAIPFSCSDPLDAVFLRTIAWEITVAKSQFDRRGNLYAHLQAARRELGLKPTSGGAPSQYISDLMKKSLLTDNFEPYDSGWKYDWRIINVPPHNIVRQLSISPIFDLISKSNGLIEYNITFRHPAISPISVFIGTGSPNPEVFLMKRGIYFIRLVESVYIGKSDEFNIRFAQHFSKQPIWWAFIVSKDDPDFGKDEQEASEALLISFWNEVAKIYNSNRGTQWVTSSPRLQKAILLAMAASANLVWLIREDKEVRSILGIEEKYWSIPFKSAKREGWPSCYLNPSYPSGI